jgi:hypothetical protein
MFAIDQFYTVSLPKTPNSSAMTKAEVDATGLAGTIIVSPD